MAVEDTCEAGTAQQTHGFAAASSFSLGNPEPSIRISRRSPSPPRGQSRALPVWRWTAAASARETRTAFHVRLPGRAGIPDAASQERTRSQFPATRVPSSLRRS